MPVKVRCKTRKALKHSRYHRLTLSANPDTWQVETVKVDELTRALCLMDAFHLRFTSSKQLFMLEPTSVTTDEADSCISPLGRRFSLEWWMWWLQQLCGQQQRGELFGVHVVICVSAAVLANAIGRGMEAAERSFCGLVSVGRLCSQRVILPWPNGPFSPPPPWFRTLGGSVRACVTRYARTYANEVAALPLRRTR